MRGAEQGGNNDPESRKKLLRLQVPKPEDIPLNGLAAFGLILSGAAVAVYEYNKHKKKSATPSGTEVPKAKKNKKQK